VGSQAFLSFACTILIDEPALAAMLLAISPLSVALDFGWKHIRAGRTNPGYKADIVKKRDGRQLLETGIALLADYQRRLAAQDGVKDAPTRGHAEELVSTPCPAWPPARQAGQFRDHDRAAIDVDLAELLRWPRLRLQGNTGHL
jgi:hypothetical protein